VLDGPADACALALERIHFAASVTGVREAVGHVEVWLDGPWPEVALPDGVRVRALDRPDREWTGRERDRPVTVLPGLVVRPPWVEPPEGFRGLDLVVPRGGAFGSGEHGSTRATLQVLAALWPRPAPQTFMDVGTGSGILARYAQLRGVEGIQACDVQGSAVDAAAELLGVHVVHGGPAELRGPVDLVVANLNGGELLACKAQLIEHWGRLLVLGGMRPPEVAGVLRGLPEPVLRREVDGYVACGFAR